MQQWLSLALTRGSCRWLVMMLSCSEDQLRWRAVAYQLFFKFKRGLDPIQICTAARYSCSWSWRLCILASATTPSLHKADSARAPANHVCAAAGPHHGQACSVGYCAQHHTAEAHGAAAGAAPRSPAKVKSDASNLMTVTQRNIIESRPRATSCFTFVDSHAAQHH